MERRTIFSPCRKYRYALWRQWGDLLSPGGVGYVQFIGLNPSTADEVLNDPTIEACIEFSKRWGYSAFCMTNVFAWRDTDPKKMKLVDEPIGEENDYWLQTIAADAGIIIAAWGNHGTHRDRNKQVVKLIPNLQCLFVNQSGQPKHPLYILRTTKPFPYRC